MAFATTPNTSIGPVVIGSVRLVHGTFTNTDTDSGGAIDTGLSSIIAADVFSTSHLGAGSSKFTVSGGTITLVTGNGVDGGWWAIGK